MKYIDADKLKAEIERRRKQRIEANDKIAKGEIFTDTEDEFNSSLARYGNRLVYQELFEIICFIETLQQEQPEADLDREIQEHIKECLDVKFPTTDIELIKKDVAYTARKFYELGINARKEE